MTPQEQQMLEGLAQRVNQTTLSEKDPDAERFIEQQLGRNPDALYILAQTVLVQQYALDQAKTQLDQLKQQAQQPKHATSFLGSLLGHRDEEPAPPPPAQQAQYQQVPNYGPPQPGYGQPQYAPSAYGQPSGYAAAPSQGGGFLRSALQTATGVAAGAMAFEGIESLMHGFGEHAGYGSGFGNLGGGMGQPREEVVNNYYGDSSPDDRGDLADRLAASGDQPSSDIEDRRDQSDFADTNSNNDQSFDDSSNDDSSSFDDGGSFDSGSSDDSGM